MSKEYRTVENIFPTWPEAKYILMNLCNDIVWPDIKLICTLNKIFFKIGLTIPDIYPLLIPAEIYYKINLIVKNVVLNYLPNQDEIQKQPGDEQGIQNIINLIKRREQKIIAETGRDLIEEIRFKFGIYTFFS